MSDTEDLRLQGAGILVIDGIEPSRVHPSSKPVQDRKPGAPERERLPPGVYVVATPIGNLGDLSARAREVLARADIVACEDTRVTRRLLAALGIAAPRLVRYDDRRGEDAARPLLEAARAGAAVALVSDAGTPLIADPGYRLVRAAHEAAIKVLAVPGPSSAVAALSIAGLPTDRFLVAGFLPAKEGARRRTIEELRPLRATLVFFEAPHRLAASLAALSAVLGPREAAVVREATKLFEEVRRGRLDQLAAQAGSGVETRGEIVIVVAPPDEAERAPAPATIDERLDEALSRSTIRDAASEVAAALGIPRREAYARALARKRGSA